MRFHIFVIGKPKLDFARLGVEEYEARLRPYAPVELHFLKAVAAVAESAALLERSKGMLRIVLDERGEHVTSRGVAQKLAHWEMHGPRDLAFLIGGAEGHGEAVRQAAGWCWALSNLTLQHEMALVLMLEQIYRACTIRAGHPYHRD